MLDGLCAVLKADIGSDLIHNSHTSALLLRQLLKQAEQWHLKMKVDLSELDSGYMTTKDILACETVLTCVVSYWGRLLVLSRRN